MRSPDRGRRMGFTLLEVLMVAVVLSILVRLAVPNLQEAVLRARAADAAADLHVVEQAARAYNADTHGWPPEADPGEVPPGLEPYLPDGFSFQREHYVMDWENWALPAGLPARPSSTRLLGVSVSTDDVLLGNALAALLGSTGWYTLGDRYTRLIEPM